MIENYVLNENLQYATNRIKMRRKIIKEIEEKYGFLFDVKEKINNLKTESL